MRSSPHCCRSVATRARFPFSAGAVEHVLRYSHTDPQLIPQTGASEKKESEPRWTLRQQWGEDAPCSSSRTERVGLAGKKFTLAGLPRPPETLA